MQKLLFALPKQVRKEVVSSLFLCFSIRYGSNATVP